MRLKNKKTRDCNLTKRILEKTFCCVVRDHSSNGIVFKALFKMLPVFGPHSIRGELQAG
jgi:hypothetical protein